MEFDKRSYMRSNCFCEAEIVISEESGDFEPISVVDLAAGGIKFIAEEGTDREYSLGSIYPIRLSIHESDVDIDDILVDIQVRRIELSANNIPAYGASFEDITLEQGIRIDEIIRYKKRRIGM
jgi:c-di-GMP-binding flagellar brake protein YcgR